MIQNQIIPCLVEGAANSLVKGVATLQCLLEEGQTNWDVYGILGTEIV
jgi:hypothetical protein